MASRKSAVAVAGVCLLLGGCTAFLSRPARSDPDWYSKYKQRQLERTVERIERNTRRK